MKNLSIREPRLRFHSFLRVPSPRVHDPPGKAPSCCVHDLARACPSLAELRSIRTGIIPGFEDLRVCSHAPRRRASALGRSERAADDPVDKPTSVERAAGSERGERASGAARSPEVAGARRGSGIGFAGPGAGRSPPTGRRHAIRLGVEWPTGADSWRGRGPAAADAQIPQPRWAIAMKNGLGYERGSRAKSGLHPGFARLECTGYLEAAAEVLETSLPTRPVRRDEDQVRLRRRRCSRIGAASVLGPSRSCPLIARHRSATRPRASSLDKLEPEIARGRALTDDPRRPQRATEA